MRLVFIMLAALPLLAVSQDSQRFSGRVLDVDGNTQIADAIVTVTTPAGFVSSVTTSKTGEFAFESLPAGEYDFRVTAHGFAIYERQVTVSGNGGVRELSIRMLVPADKQTVSIAELRKSDVIRTGISSNGSAHRGY